MSVTSFTAKQLRVTLILSPQNSNGVFPGTNSNTLVVENLRTTANIQTVPGSVSTHANVKIYGMDQRYMNALTTIFFNSSQQIVFNNMIVEQNSGSGWTQVFSGMIIEAQPVYPPGSPAAFFCLQGIVGYQHQINPVPPSSYQGSVSVSSIVQDLAGKMNYAFENDGVTAQINNPYLSGTYWDQLNRVCTATNTQYTVTADTLFIYPGGIARSNPPILTLGPKSGLEGYPTLEKFGIVISSLYNPALQAGGKIKVVGSDIPGANGLWYPFMVDHQLEALAPGGRWHSVSQCLPVKQ